MLHYCSYRPHKGYFSLTEEKNQNSLTILNIDVVAYGGVKKKINKKCRKDIKATGELRIK